jgi:alpha-beta hydrolase superfamily lysophospholipase
MALKLHDLDSKPDKSNKEKIHGYNHNQRRNADFYKDCGKGQPIVFSHGWPLTADDWDAQMLFFGQQGYRVIAHDRRGHGRSTQTSDGNDMDTYADDLAQLTEKLDAKDGGEPGRHTDRSVRRHAGWSRI